MPSPSAPDGDCARTRGPALRGVEVRDIDRRSPPMSRLLMITGRHTPAVPDRLQCRLAGQDQRQARTAFRPYCTSVAGRTLDAAGELE